MATDLESLNARVADRTFLNGNTVSDEDFSGFAAAEQSLNSLIEAAKGKPADIANVVQKYANAVRYLNLIYFLQSKQNNSAYTRSAAVAAALQPPPSALISSSYQSTSVSSPLASTAASAPSAAAAAANNDEQKQSADKAAAPAESAAAGAGEKAKKEKKPKEAKEPKPEPAVEPTARRLNIKVARIISAVPHATDDKLFVLSVDVGAAEPIPVVTGLVGYYTAERLIEKVVACIVNVKAGEVKGTLSAGRLLVATSADKITKELLEPPAGAKVGDAISLAGVNTAPDGVVASKHLSEIWKGTITGADCIAAYTEKGVTWQFAVKDVGFVTAPTVPSGTVA